MGKVACSKTIQARTMSSMCGRDSRISIPAVLDMFQDIAGIHADSIGIGALELEEQGLFWIVSRMKLRVYGRPLVGDMLDLSTWILPADRATCERDCSISKDGSMLAYCRCVWAALRRDNARPARMSEFYPEPDQLMETPDSEPFARMSKDFSGAEQLGEYTIRSVDIDRGGHMNNVNYVRAMLGCFTCDEIDGMDIHELDMQFLQQCYEGETIRFVKRPSGNALMEIGAINEEGAVCFMAAVK